MKSRWTLLPLLVAAGSSSTLLAQTPLHAQYGDTNNDHFGFAATELGDVDNDGVSDYVFGANDQAGAVGYARVCSGATGQTITTLTGAAANDGFGSAVAGVGDINGDQVPDLLVGAFNDGTLGPPGVVRIYSGADWSVLREQTRSTWHGQSAAVLGDVNGDGVAEYLVNDLGTTGGRAAVCYCGATGAQLWQFDANIFEDPSNHSPTIGDATGDGVPDALIGSNGLTATSYAVVLDGTDGSEVHRVEGSSLVLFAEAVSWIGDLNGDQRSEFLVGLPWMNAPVGQINVYDGATAALLYSFQGTFELGRRICAMDDQNGDGNPDFVASDNGTTHLFSGANGNLIHSFDSSNITTNTLACVAPVGDLDGDGQLDLLQGTQGTGIVFLSSAYPFQDLGSALGGSQGDPLLVGEGTLEAGSIGRARLSNARASTPMFLVAGLSAWNLPLFGGTLVPAPDLVCSYTSSGSGDLDLYLPAMPTGIPGPSSYYMQFWIFDPTGPEGATASNALMAVFP